MHAIFKSLLTISLYTSILILILLCCMPVLHKFFSHKLSRLVWLLVASRLLIPLQFSNPIIITLQTPTQTSESITVPIDMDLPHNGAIHTLENTIDNDIKNISANTTDVFFTDIYLPYIWLAGAVLSLLIHLIGHIRQHMQIIKQTPRDEDVKALHNCMTRLQIKQKIPMYRSVSVTSPMISGLFYPEVILPNLAFSPDELRCVLFHELHHYKRGDLWYKLLLILILSMHWFNPFVYMMVKSANMCMELACDEAVLKNTSMQERITYAQTLLKPLKAHCAFKHVNFYGGAKQMENRFRFILEKAPKRKGRVILIFSFVCVLLLGCTFTTEYFYPSNEPRVKNASISVNQDENKTIEKRISGTDLLYPQPSEKLKNHLDTIEKNDWLYDPEYMKYFAQIRGILLSSKPLEPYTLKEDKWNAPIMYKHALMTKVPGNPNMEIADMYNLLFSSDEPQPISSICKGKVIAVTDRETLDATKPLDIALAIMPKHIVVEYDNRVWVRYFHMDKIYVREGQEIGKGDIIGTTAFIRPGEEPYMSAIHILIDRFNSDPRQFFDIPLEVI